MALAHNIFSSYYFSKKIGFDISCQLFLSTETINKKNKTQFFSNNYETYDKISPIETTHQKNRIQFSQKL